MKKRKILLPLLLSAVMVASAAACGTSTPSVSVSSQENGASTPSIASAVSQSAVESSNVESSATKYSDDNDTKVKQMMENVTFDGKKLPFPFKASDLGSGYSFSDDVSVYEDKYAITYILYNGEKVTTIDLLEYYEQKNVNDCYANGITLSNTDDSKFHDLLKIDEIGLGDNIYDAINKFGKPTRIEEFESGNTYIYESVKENKVTQINILTDTNDLIENITM